MVTRLSSDWTEGVCAFKHLDLSYRVFTDENIPSHTTAKLSYHEDNEALLLHKKIWTENKSGLSWGSVSWSTKCLPNLPLTATLTLSRTSLRPATWKRTRWTSGVRILGPFWRPLCAWSAATWLSERRAAAFTHWRQESRQIRRGAECKPLSKRKNQRQSDVGQT